jgi:hypothetical protein
MAVVAVYKLNSELQSIFLENKNGMGSASSYLLAKTVLVLPILVCFAFAALGIPGFLIQNFPVSSFSRHILLWTVQIATWECSAEAFAAIFDDSVLGMLIHTGWWFAALLFSGYLVSVEDVSFNSLCVLALNLVLCTHDRHAPSLDVLAAQGVLLYPSLQLLHPKCHVPDFHRKYVGSLHRSNNVSRVCE